MRVFITGDSHTAALRRGLEQLQESGWSARGIDMDVLGLGSGEHLVTPFFEDTGTFARIVEASYKNRIPQLPLPDSTSDETIYCWCGLFHFARLWRNGSWIVSRPATMTGSRIPISTALIGSVVRDWFKYQLGLVDVMQRSGVKVIAVESPRPFRHHPALRLVRPEVAAAVDRICQDVMLAELRQRDVDLVRIPPECLDAEGFMDPKWRSSKTTDPHHGNPQFGEIMIKRICQHLQGEIDG